MSAHPFSILRSPLASDFDAQPFAVQKARHLVFLSWPTSLFGRVSQGNLERKHRFSGMVEGFSTNKFGRVSTGAPCFGWSWTGLDWGSQSEHQGMAMSETEDTGVIMLVHFLGPGVEKSTAGWWFPT